jgi:hypothetical protein
MRDNHACILNIDGFRPHCIVIRSDLVKSQTSYQPAPAPLRGLGAGLCLSNIFATHFGGSLAIESGGIGKGTTVTLFIPRSTDILEAQ